MKFIFILLLFIPLRTTAQDSTQYKPAEFKEGVYVNPEPIVDIGFTKGLKLLGKLITEDQPWQTPEDSIPVKSLRDLELVEGDSVSSFYKLGHSSVLLKHKGRLILTDPVFSERASPFQWIGPRRFHKNPIEANQLPPIDVVLISHNYYDHLDENTIIQLEEYTPQFVVPMGVKSLLLEWGVKSDRVKECNWWDAFEFDNIKITSVPTRHFTGRGIFDRFKSLWTGYVIELDSIKVYFSGDTGYNQGFKLAQKKFGDFDLAFLEAGAYNENWNKVHMLPPETIQAAKDLKTKFIVPIHNGTFDLAFHPWFDPLEQAVFFANKAGIPILTPIFGQKVIIDHQLLELSQNEKSKWWKPLLPKEYLFKPWSTPNSK